MTEAVNNGNWQSLGSTLQQEYRFVTHLQEPPQQLPPRHRTSSLRRSNSVRTFNRGGSQISSGVNLRRHNAIKRSAKDRIMKFLRRFSWKRHVKGYMFGKSYLQRQPSLVITPDISSFSYYFTSRDLAKRKPLPRYNRTSRPTAAWKNSNPMEILMGGKADLPHISNTLKNKINIDDDALHSTTDSSGHTHHPTHSEAFRDLSKDKDDINNKNGPNWVRISLPPKENKGQFKSTSTDSELNSNEGSDVPLNKPSTESEAKDTAQPHVQEKEAGIQDHKAKSTSWIDAMPQTPIQGYSSREFGGTDAPNENTTPQEPASPERKSLLGYAVTASPPESPTSLPSNYRPESWRRSAILTRNSYYPSPNESSHSLDGLADTWSSYLRQAVAQRAVNNKERWSRDLRNEIRWSENLDFDSGSESMRSEVSLVYSLNSEVITSSISTPSTMYKSTSNLEQTPSRLVQHARSQYYTPNSEIEGTPYSSDSGSRKIVMNDAKKSMDSGSNVNQNDDAYSDTSSGSIPKTPVLSTRPTSAVIPPVSPLSTAYAVTTHDAVKSPTLVRVKSPHRLSVTKLAPLNSPRAMASASALASASAASLADSLISRGSDDADRNLKGSEWLRETGSSVSLAPSSQSSVGSSSLFNEDDYIFPQAENDEPLDQTNDTIKAGTHSIPDEFDFSKRSISLKRPASPPGTLPELWTGPSEGPSSLLRNNTENVSQRDLGLGHSRSHSADSISSSSSGENNESAATIVRQQSQWKQRSLSLYGTGSNSLGQKRIKSTGSKEYLLHTRQKTMESQWGEEDDSE